jgi:hypothetical protein
LPNSEPNYPTRKPENPAFKSRGNYLSQNVDQPVKIKMDKQDQMVDLQLKRLSAKVALLEAQARKPSHTISPWLPLKEAASCLNFRSARALRNRIKSGTFPPDCYCVDPTAPPGVKRYLIHVERYIKKLR